MLLRFLFLALFACAPALRAATSLGGTVSSSRTVSGDITITSSVTVPSGVVLKFAEGSIVRVPASTSISAQAGGAIEVAGTALNPALFSGTTTGAKWGNIAASGANSSVTIRFAEIAGGGVNLGSSATGLIEDSYIHDVTSAIVGNSAKFVTMRRNHIKNFAETIFNSGTVILAEDSLYENQTDNDSDALEIQGGPPGSIVQRCTFRHSKGSNSDACDFNGTSGVFIHDCLIYDFTDKGISMGASGAGGSPDYGMIISNCVIYGTSIGIAVKDGSTCGIYQTTVADCATGYRLYQKFTTPVAGGHITNAWNNIVWNTPRALDLANNSTVAATYTDFQGTNFPGVGNLSVDPVFVNGASRDYRLSASSPLWGSGFQGRDLGAQFPVGAPMAPSHPWLQPPVVAGGQLLLHFAVDPDRTYSLLASPALPGNWASLTNNISTVLPGLVEVAVPLTGPRSFFEISASAPR